MGSMGGEIDDFTIMTPQHVRQDGMGNVHRAAEIDINIDVPHVLLHLDEGPDTAGTTGAIYQDIYMVERFLGFFTAVSTVTLSEISTFKAKDFLLNFIL
jgi:hypothetical protein